MTISQTHVIFGRDPKIQISRFMLLKQMKGSSSSELTPTVADSLSVSILARGSSGYFPQANYTLSRNEYYVPQSTVAGEPTWEEEDFSGLNWPGPYSSTLSKPYYTLTSSPLEVEELTSCLLQNLRAYRSKVTRTKKGTMLADSLSKLPTEILDNILAAMGRNIPPESSHLLPQRLWRDQLKAGSRGLLPWLWDIDPACIDAKDSEP
ncbi:uncharacterized protein BDZ83DRAFT_760498 [Colletotrichum acutatum]|uniref:Uncharacterized protein n=1 Tax=Glomerella acutata TaxID=27357 RepID=A0AAD8UGS4_GLOAC|nr:uncharacterized protein BDZ83DRAFT_760498 [Colletotrichum acutatum]KAK1718054.1 hypothetical protein BDZ83DRAFT_760498 [Colletotrichum acutatum]